MRLLDTTWICRCEKFSKTRHTDILWVWKILYNILFIYLIKNIVRSRSKYKTHHKPAQQIFRKLHSKEVFTK